MSLREAVKLLGAHSIYLYDISILIFLLCKKGFLTYIVNLIYICKSGAV
jgi:hypothetical protein